MSNAWRKQRVQKEIVKSENIPSHEKVYGMLSSIGNHRDRALITLMYLTGGRVSEVLHLKQHDLNISFVEQERFMIIDMVNRKNKIRTRKTIPISYEREYKFIELLKGFIERVKPGAPLFPISVARAGQIIARYSDWNPHWIRHIRLSHLVLVYNFNAHQLQLFAGWTDTRPAKHYIEMNWRDLAKSF